MDPLVNSAKQSMQKILEMLRVDLASVRTGRATPALIEDVEVVVYSGSARMKIKELATITATDATTLAVAPFDNAILNEMQKGIMEANIGLTPSNDGNLIRISIPPLSAERRQDLIKLMHQKLENGKIMVRQERHEAMGEMKKNELAEDEKSRLEKEIQNLTDSANSEIDTMGKKKEEELLQI